MKTSPRLKHAGLDFYPSREKLRSAIAYCAIAIVIISILNVWTFSSAVATPLVQADDWYFLEHFVAHWLDGHLVIRDFFIRRGSDDHIQPIQKLVLLFHTKYFDMDFRVEGLIGVSFGILLCSIVGSQLAKSEKNNWRHALTPLFTAGIFALGLSINSTGIYTWPLVTLSFCDLLLTSLQIIAFLRWGGRLALLAISTFLLSLAIDKIAIIALVASVLAALIGANWSLKQCFKPFIAALIGLVLARITLSHLSPGEMSSGSVFHQINKFSAVLARPDAWKLFALPLVNSVAVLEHIKSWWPSNEGIAILVIALVMGALHTWFWWTVIVQRIRGIGNAQTGFAVALMLLSYGLLFGIVFWRIPQFGWDYLNQPRYVVMYQLSCLAMLVLAHAQWIRDDGYSHRFHRLVQLGIVVVAMMIQIPAAKASWGLVTYISAYWSKASLFLGDSAKEPTINARRCPDIFVFCDYDPEHRTKVLHLLESHHLNVFSPGFQLRNRLYPSTIDMPAPEASPK